MDNARSATADKACHICGNVGYPEYIMTCCRCKKATEHIYCMQNQLYEVPETWYCELCLLSSQVVHNGEAQDTHKERTNFEKPNTPVERSLRLNDKASSEQINGDGKQLIGSPKPLSFQDSSLKVLDVGKEQRVPVKVSPSSKHVMQPSSHKSSFKAVETGKVKFIPAEEIAFLGCGVKLSGKRGSLGAASHRTDQANIKSPHILQRKSSSLSILASTMESKVLCQPIVGSVDADALRIMTVEHATNEKEEKFQRNKSSGEEFFSVLCKEKSIEGSVGAEVHLSSSKHTTSPEAEGDSNAPPLHIVNEQKKTAIEKSSVEEALVGPIDIKPTVGYAYGEEVSPSEYIRSIESKCVNSGFPHSITIKKEKMGVGDFTEEEAIAGPSRDHASEVQTLKAHIPDRELSVLHSEITLNFSMTDGSGSVFCPDAQLEKSGFQEMDNQLTLLINPEEKYSNRPSPEACWKGTFEVFDVVFHIYDGVRAHFPARVSHKAYEILKKMPEKLKFMTLPRMYAWPHTFRLYPPTEDDIGLYFFPCEHERLKEKYIRLLERIDSHDFVMKSYVGDVELLIFTSKQLQVYSQCTAAETYLWGIFHHVKRKRPGKHLHEHISSCSPAAAMRSDNCGPLNISLEVKTEEVDMVGGTEIRKIDGPLPIFDSPPGFANPISKDHLKKSLVKLPLKEEAGPILLDVPPGFSRTPSSKQACRSPESTYESSAFSGKKSRDLVSSSIGEGYETSASKACQLQSKQHQDGLNLKRKQPDLRPTDCESPRSSSPLSTRRQRPKKTLSLSKLSDAALQHPST